VLSALTAYAAFSFDWVTRPYLEMPWTLPAPIGAFLSTGGDWRGLMLQLFNLGLGLLVYWPFVRRYDAELLGREEANPAAPPAPGLSTESRAA
jgi:cellobiose PTS system EIIC component